MNLRELYPARFIAAEDFKGKQRTLTIARVAKEKVGHGGDEEMAVIVYFNELSKITNEAVQLVLCRTNAEYIGALFGSSESNDWIGHKVTLGPEMVESFGEIVPAIRVQGSPELAAPVKYTPKKGRRIKPKTLVPTATTTTTTTPAPAPAATDAPLTARCEDCGWESVLTPDATADDVATTSCDACGGPMEVA